MAKTFKINLEQHPLMKHEWAEIDHFMTFETNRMVQRGDIIDLDCVKFCTGKYWRVVDIIHYDVDGVVAYLQYLPEFENLTIE